MVISKSRWLAAALALGVALALLTSRQRESWSNPPGPYDHSATRFPLEGPHRSVSCESCHPPVGSGSDARKWKDVPTDCRGCHGERKNHKGTLGTSCEKCHSVSEWKAIRHDAASHKFPLTGKHALPCTSCHAGGSHLVSTAATACADCHRQPHAGTQVACETCHRTESWKATSFRHSFDWARLPGKHESATCLGCHQGFRFQGTSFQCSSCHDDKRAHDALGACETCHSATSTWKAPLLFKHDAPSVAFRLEGGHKNVACAKCHQPARVFAAASRTCEGCHTTTPHADLGPCAKCHTTTSFSVRGFSHDKTRFPLDERHRAATCAQCHQRVAPGAFTPGNDACATCHADVHAGQFAQKPCTQCHNTRAWKPSIIDAAQHGRFSFALKGQHQRVECARCHSDMGAQKSAENSPAMPPANAHRFVGTPSACVSCHADRHQGLLGAECATCHDEREWSEHPAFDHGARTGYRIEGTHGRLSCDNCHQNGDKRRASAGQTNNCASCHTPKHGTAFGANCTGCHDQTNFANAKSFDHSRTLFPLERRHRSVRCGDCHTAKSTRAPDPNCRSCHGDPHGGRTFFDCANCHRADSWLLVRYDHDLAEFPLKGKHFFTPCRDCHTNDVWTGMRRECVSCHRGDRQAADVRHPGHAALSWNCIDCHRPWSWSARP